jgi:hypothetical protein
LTLDGLSVGVNVGDLDLDRGVVLGRDQSVCQCQITARQGSTRGSVKTYWWPNSVGGCTSRRGLLCRSLDNVSVRSHTSLGQSSRSRRRCHCRRSLTPVICQAPGCNTSSPTSFNRPLRSPSCPKISLHDESDGGSNSDEMRLCFKEQQLTHFDK